MRFPASDLALLRDTVKKKKKKTLRWTITDCVIITVPWHTEGGAETDGDLQPIRSGVQWL